RYNIPDIGVFLWRLRAYPLERVTATPIAPGCFAVHPVGLDAAMFRQPPASPEFTKGVSPDQVPAPLPRRVLSDALERSRYAHACDLPLPAPVYFSPDAPAFAVYADGETSPIPAEEIMVCDLSGPAPWRLPARLQRYQCRPVDAAEADSAVGLFQ